MFPNQEDKNGQKVCSMLLAVVSEKDLFPIRAQGWQKEDDSGRVLLQGQAPGINQPPGRATKPGIGCGTELYKPFV